MRNLQRLELVLPWPWIWVQFFSIIATSFVDKKPFLGSHERQEGNVYHPSATILRVLSLEVIPSVPPKVCGMERYVGNSSASMVWYHKIELHMALR